MGANHGVTACGRGVKRLHDAHATGCQPEPVPGAAHLLLHSSLVLRKLIRAPIPLAGYRCAAFPGYHGYLASLTGDVVQ